MSRRPLYFTFGNHMHWVDMQWLWGYDVLPGSIRDMLHLIRETGVRGNVNFDVIGYERLAGESPEALAELREAVRQGLVEPVGCTWGEPYGLFHGGESNIRQLTFGVRGTRRLLGVRPRTFWEEEFYFFPQLPQMLANCGFRHANLFFQWTWHTPELPKEDVNLILWEGIDGTRLPALPRNDLNVHQWPEDFEGLLDSELVSQLEPPVIVQWLELMPSRDWMCRSEVLLPPLRTFLQDERFEIIPGTCSDLIQGLLTQRRESGATPQSVSSAASEDAAPVRRYRLDDVWHGMGLGRNADRHPRTSWETERLILAAEAMSAVAGIFGRPYPSWDVYPTWELDEAWRQMLAAQHHDNHECEALCGFVGYAQFEMAQRMAGLVLERTVHHLLGRATELVSPIEDEEGGAEVVVTREASSGPARAARRATPPATDDVDFDDDDMDEALEDDDDDDEGAFDQDDSRSIDDTPVIAVNPWGWTRDVPVDLWDLEAPMVARDVPPFGFVAGRLNGPGFERLDDCDVDYGRDDITLSAGELAVTVDRERGVITQIRSADFPDGLLEPGHPLLDLIMTIDGQDLRFDETEVETSSIDSELIYIERTHPLGGAIHIEVALDRVRGGVRIDLSLDQLRRPDPGMHAGLRMSVRPAFDRPRLLVDAPYSIEEVRPNATRLRKYPTGDWMTSPQWFEEIRNPFNALHLVDFVEGDATGHESAADALRGFMLVGVGAKQYFAELNEAGQVTAATALITMFDPWDEKFDPAAFGAGPHYRIWLFPHGRLSNADRFRCAWGALGVSPATYALPRHLMSSGTSGAVADHAPAEAPAPASVRFGTVEVQGAPNVLATALHRESPKSGEHLPGWAGHALRRQSGGACEHPYVLRLVECDGRSADEVVVCVAGEVAGAARVTMTGEVVAPFDAAEVSGDGGAAEPHEVEGDRRGGLDRAVDHGNDATSGRGRASRSTEWLEAGPCPPPAWAANTSVGGQPVRWSSVRLRMDPHEIVTLMFDLVPGRKAYRDLDAKREIWATVHRVETPGPS